MIGKIAVGILCGGGSRRMGSDKAGLPWKDTTLLDRIVKEMREGAGRRVYLSVGSAGPHARTEPEVYRPYRELCVPDEYPGLGPLEGIRRIFQVSGEDALFICAVDMPFVTRETVEYLERFWYDEYDCVIFQDKNGPHPLCGIYGKQVLPVIERQMAQGDYRVMDILDRCRVKRVELEESPLPEETLMNLNTPDEYRKNL